MEIYIVLNVTSGPLVHSAYYILEQAEAVKRLDEAHRVDKLLLWNKLDIITTRSSLIEEDSIELQNHPDLRLDNFQRRLVYDSLAWSERLIAESLQRSQPAQSPQDLYALEPILSLPK